MSYILKIEDWAEHHHPLWTDFLRIILGVILILKGFLFAEHQEVITNLLLENHLQYLIFMAAHYVIIMHIAGGILIAFGLLTRFACLMNLPILIAAVLFNNISPNLLPFNSELLISIIVLILLAFFMVLGDGKFSADHFINDHTDIW